jgi:hypothetical protein
MKVMQMLLSAGCNLDDFPELDAHPYTPKERTAIIATLRAMVDIMTR